MARVLIADDEPAIAASLEFLLRAAGHDTSMARDGEEALTMAARLQPALIVLDLMLPRRNGLEVCRTLRADPHQSSVKVLMLTARGGKLDISGGLSAGADAYLVKPFSTKDLLAHVGRLLTPGEAAYAGNANPQ